TAEGDEAMEALSGAAMAAYRRLIDDPNLLPYYQSASPLEELTLLNMGSRPARRFGAQSPRARERPPPPHRGSPPPPPLRRPVPQRPQGDPVGVRLVAEPALRAGLVRRRERHSHLPSGARAARLQPARADVQRLAPVPIDRGRGREDALVRGPRARPGIRLAGPGRLGTRCHL